MEHECEGYADPFDLRNNIGCLKKESHQSIVKIPGTFIHNAEPSF